MKQTAKYWIGLLILVALWFGFLRCTNERKVTKWLKTHTIDGQVTVDTIAETDTVVIHTTSTITETMLDSIVFECTPDTIVRERIKTKIVNACTIEQLLGGPKIIEEGHVKLKIWATGNEFNVQILSKNIVKEVVKYLPCPDCDCNHWQWFLAGILLGFFGFLGLKTAAKALI